jgi:hypothetical protein
MLLDRECNPAVLALIGTVVFTSTLALLTSPSWAASVCYDETFYPSIVRLEKTESGVQAFLGGKFFNETRGRPPERLAMRFTDKNGWQREHPLVCRENSDCLPTKETKAHDIPSITLSKKGAIALVPRLRNAESIEQTVSDWTERDGFIWFGISFYSGEGVDGVGGIGRFDPLLNKTLIRRPKAILDSSINRIVHDGEWLWFGTVGHYECMGQPPTHGLLRYTWGTDQIESFEGKEDGPCGFLVHDLLLEQHALWVATDLGLSRFNRRSKSWDHFVPDPTASPPMKPTSCAAIYTELQNTLPRAVTLGDVDPRSQLFNALKRFRPRYLTKRIEGIPPSDLTCDESKLLAARISDYQTLKTKLVIHHPVGSRNLICILEAYRGKDAQNPEIRDLLLSSLAKAASNDMNQEEATLDLLTRFSGDTTVGEALVARLKTMPNPRREAELLPSMIGSRSVPHLIAALERFTDVKRQGHIMRSAVIALSEATGIVIGPNGAVTSKTSNVAWDTHYFNANAIRLVAAQWRKWWDTHKTEYASGLPDANQLAHNAVRGGRVMEPKVTLSGPTTMLPLGTVATLTARVTNLAASEKPPIPNFTLIFQVKLGPHAALVTPIRGVTDSKGILTFQYTGIRSGEDRVLVFHEGDELFVEEQAIVATWDGPDLVVPVFIPPVLMTKGGNSFFVSEWTQNIGKFPDASTTRYFLSPTNPVDPGKARMVGKRTVPPLAPGERSEVRQQSFTIPDDLPAGTYYLAGCADAAEKVLEANEQNNCSFNQVPGQAAIIAPSMSIQNAPQ